MKRRSFLRGLITLPVAGSVIAAVAKDSIPVGEESPIIYQEIAKLDSYKEYSWGVWSPRGVCIDEIVKQIEEFWFDKVPLVEERKIIMWVNKPAYEHYVKLVEKEFEKSCQKRDYSLAHTLEGKMRWLSGLREGLDPVDSTKTKLKPACTPNTFLPELKLSKTDGQNLQITKMHSKSLLEDFLNYRPQHSPKSIENSKIKP